MSSQQQQQPQTLNITLASRASQLAQIQTHIVRDKLNFAFPSTPSHKYEFVERFMRTAGDKNQDKALYVLGGVGGAAGGKSLWTEELEDALLREPEPPTKEGGEVKEGKEGGGEDATIGRVDMLVHSLKDVPTTLPPGCELGAILEREDPADSLVVKQGLSYKSLDDLPEGSVVGTSSVRRVAQLRRKYPKLQFADVRGNLNTRLSKLDSPTGPYTALILAKAGLVRLGMGSRITADLTPPTLYHAVGQAALGVEIRAADPLIKSLCLALNHQPSEWRCKAERAMLRVLEGGCSVPVGVSTTLIPVGKDEDPKPRARLTITGTVTSLDGLKHVEETLEDEVGSSEDAERLGEKLAKRLVETGAKEILEEIQKDKEKRVAAEANKQ
ncbi:porphobilinogen deaminase [Fomitiporia mediterranea MF3/22]|uniref:porphobilinogen deaminase n=1 Tax=Fomitiporia mediterranea (strain MF3/22) TaxID=694068 RepID=UPI0004409A18|nr:porphobilinogen deaminase [Fomitiporia mediterranea MF3/22]EJD04488.1 porphobilinogen deaminase [Fomitiporia mediterranea MF3/22]